jgi:hypothetical protein
VTHPKPYDDFPTLVAIAWGIVFGLIPAPWWWTFRGMAMVAAVIALYAAGETIYERRLYRNDPEVRTLTAGKIVGLAITTLILDGLFMVIVALAVRGFRTVVWG